LSEKANRTFLVCPGGKLTGREAGTRDGRVKPLGSTLEEVVTICLHAELRGQSSSGGWGQVRLKICCNEYGGTIVWGSVYEGSLGLNLVEEKRGWTTFLRTYWLEISGKFI